MKKIYETSEWQHVRNVMLEPSDILAIATTHSASDFNNEALAMVSDHTFDEIKEAVISYNMRNILTKDYYNNIIGPNIVEPCMFEGELFLVGIAISKPDGSEPNMPDVILVAASTAEKYTGEDDWMSLDEYFETLP